MRDRLTQRQRSLLAIVKDFIKREGYSPSLRDLAVGLRCDHSTVREILIPLERKGYITRKPKVSRSIRLLSAGNRINNGDGSNSKGPFTPPYQKAA
jgi:repressor LexA